MTFLNRLLTPTSLQAGTAPLPGWLAHFVTPTASREQVTPDTALKVSTFYACVSLIADSVAMLPKFVYERLSENERRRADDHPLYDVLHTRPNSDQTSFEFFQMMTGHAAMRGHSYAKIMPGVRGFVDQLRPVHPGNVQIDKLANGRYRYLIIDPDGVQRPYNDEDILHLRRFTLDGIVGVDLVHQARESLGLSLASQKYGARFYGNNASPTGILKSKGKLSSDAQKRLKESWEEMHGGARQHGTGVLEEGLEWQQVGIDPRAAQFIEREEYQAEDVCRWLRVPPHMVGLTSKSTSWGTGIEQMSIGFVTYTLMPWLVAWQQAITRDLILAPRKYFVEFEPMMLLRGDSQARYNVYKIGRELGVFSPNEIRRLENMNPREDPGGDDYIQDMGRSLAKPLDSPSGQAEAQTFGSELEEAEPPQHQGGEPHPHHAALLRESAARVVRKEIMALTKAAQRNPVSRGANGGSARAWEKAVHDFYRDHAEFVAQALCMSYEAAQAYVAGQVQMLLEQGLSALDEGQAVQALVAMALEE